MSALSKLFGAKTITTAANEYHYSEKMATNKAGWKYTSEKPVFIERLYARKNLLRDTWNIYSVTDHPRNLITINGMVIDDRHGKTKTIAKNLGLGEAFNRVRAFEEFPAQRAMSTQYWDREKEEFTVPPMLTKAYGIPRDGTLFLVQKQPKETDHTYWRNMSSPA
jgi:hypothetical protein